MSKVVWSIALAITMFAVASAQQPATPSGVNSEGADSLNLQGNIERITDVQTADCGPYLAKVLQTIRSNWVPIVPPEAKAPQLKSGKGAIEFTIMPDGRVSGLKTVSSTGDTALDQAASQAITKSQPFASLPSEFQVSALTLRFRFAYNPKSGDPSDETKKPGN